MNRFSISMVSVSMYLTAGLAWAASEPPPPGSWTIVLLPDTQNYAQSYPSVGHFQTQWIAQNKDLHRPAARVDLARDDEPVPAVIAQPAEHDKTLAFNAELPQQGEVHSLACILHEELGRDAEFLCGHPVQRSHFGNTVDSHFASFLRREVPFGSVLCHFTVAQTAAAWRRHNSATEAVPSASPVRGDST